MKRLVCVTWATVSLLAMTLSPAAADDGYWHLDFNFPAGSALPLRVGVDEGGGFGFVTLTDDDSDGIIHLPLIPVGSRLAVGVNHTGDVDDCDLWDLVGPDVQRGGSSIDVPLLTNATTGESVGIDFGDLMVPPLTLTPGDRFTVVNGMMPGWPEIRVVDESGVPDLETFVRDVDLLPDFNGDVEVSNAVVQFRFVPEPTTCALALVALCFAISRRRSC